MLLRTVNYFVIRLRYVNSFSCIVILHWQWVTILTLKFEDLLILFYTYELNFYANKQLLNLYANKQ